MPVTAGAGDMFRDDPLNENKKSRRTTGPSALRMILVSRQQSVAFGILQLNRQAVEEALELLGSDGML